MNKTFIATFLLISAVGLSGCATTTSPHNPTYIKNYHHTSYCNTCNSSNNSSNQVGYWGAPPPQQWQTNSCQCDTPRKCACGPCGRGCETNWNTYTSDCGGCSNRVW